MVEQKDIDEMKGMVRWFDPSVLFTVIKPVIISGIFGEYADRRLVHAALDPADTDELLNRADIRSSFTEDPDGSIWFDYAADTGDGFNSTYAIASTLAQPTPKIGTLNTRRGDLLVLGGDQVYPDASLDTYSERFRKPFAWAFPNQDQLEEESHPLIYAVPGNHDWYDGLTLFLALFCKKVRWSIGNWRVPQCRSYFALRLAEDWWLWGVDIGLSEDVDQPQADYFATIAAHMPRSSKLIICTAAPGWLYGRTRNDETESHRAYRSLGYYAAIARKADKDIQIPLVLSGDTHHYSRYSAQNAGTQFITAGGGGAFLHPTHQVKEDVSAWWFKTNDSIRLARLEEKSGEDGDLAAGDDVTSPAACYPSHKTSRRLLFGNLAFPFKNWKFSAILGGSYSASGLLMLMWSDLSTFVNVVANPLWLAVSLVHFIVFWRYADDANWVLNGVILRPKSSPKFRQLVLGASHAMSHTIVLTVLSSWIYAIGIDKLGLTFWTWSFNAYFVLAMTLCGGLIAGFLFGSYLSLCCRWLGVHANDAFSAMSLDSYKNFLRMRIKDNQVTVFPIGLDEVPSRDQWIPNPKHADDNTAPVVISRDPISYRLIEGPIDIS